MDTNPTSRNVKYSGKETAREKIKVTMVCPACGQSGSALLAGEGASGAFSPETLTNLSTQFYFRMPRSLVGALQVVCSKCGAVLD